MGEQRAAEHPASEPEGDGFGLDRIDPEEAVRAVAEMARENPHATLAGAFAVGFLLGGGLTPRLLASLALFAGRRYAQTAVREALGAVVRRQMDEVAAP